MKVEGTGEFLILMNLLVFKKCFQPNYFLSCVKGRARSTEPT